MKRLVFGPAVLALAVSAGAVAAAETQPAQSYGYNERESVTYQEEIRSPVDATGSAYGNSRAGTYDDAYDESYGDSAEDTYARNATPREPYNNGHLVPVITPDRHGRDGEFAMARVVSVDPLVSRDAGCSADDRYADQGGQDGYRGVPANDGYQRDEYYGDDYQRSDPYHGDQYGGDPYAGGYQRAGYGNGGQYGPPVPHTTGMGAAIGAIIGGVLGNAVADDHDDYYGGYSGEQAAATALGAVLGGAVGAGIEREVVRRRQVAYHGQQQAYGQDGYRQDGYPQGGSGQDGYSQSASTCGVEGYRVTYEYAGQRYQSVTDYDPGEEMRVRIEMTPGG